MKKNYFLLAASTMLFAACAQTDTVNEVVTEEVPQAIGFETFAQKATRAENSNATYTYAMKDHHDKFSVWAYKNVSETPVFEGRDVNSDTYDYGNKVYWDKTADWYEFYAAAPASDSWKFNGISENQTDKSAAYFTMDNAKLNATNFVSSPNETHLKSFKTENSDADTDWMIADECKVEKANYANATNNSKVQLNFIHILSRLNIIVKKGTGNAIPNIILNSVKVNGIKTIGSFDENKKDPNGTDGTTNGTGTTERWTIAADANSTVYEFAPQNGYSLETNDNYVIQSLVIPQNVKYESIKTDGAEIEAKTAKEAYIEIIYTINDEEFKAYYNLAQVFGATSTTDNDGTTINGTIAFNEGWQNTLTITIAPAEINFEGTVAEWATNEDDNLTIE